MSLEKIMVVDDDPNICELLRLYLEKEGYTVEIVNDGMAAVEAFQSAQPDLVPVSYTHLTLPTIA